MAHLCNGALGHCGAIRHRRELSGLSGGALQRGLRPRELDLYCAAQEHGLAKAMEHMTTEHGALELMKHNISIYYIICMI